MENGTCTQPSKNLHAGGQPDFFLVALMWASGIHCMFSYIFLEFKQDLIQQQRAILDIDYTFAALNKENATLSDLARKVIISLPVMPVHVLTFAMHSSKGYKAPQDSRKVIHLLNELVDVASQMSMSIEGVVITLLRVGGGHVVSIYPCVVQGKLRWISCNSWGDNCHRGDFIDFVVDLCDQKLYTHFGEIILLLKQK